MLVDTVGATKPNAFIRFFVSRVRSLAPFARTHLAARKRRDRRGGTRDRRAAEGQLHDHRAESPRQRGALLNFAEFFACLVVILLYPEGTRISCCDLKHVS